MQNKANLRKGQMNITIFNTKDYENRPAVGVLENKAKQSQFVFLTAENAEYAEKNNTCVSDCPIEKYALYPISPCSLRTRRLMKNKAKQSQFPSHQSRVSCALVTAPGKASIYTYQFAAGPSFQAGRALGALVTDGDPLMGSISAGI
jgi:hypothetical protein